MPESNLLSQPMFLPHIYLLLQSLRISHDRLNSRSKVAIDTRLLRTLLQSLARQLVFNAEFYLRNNPDIAVAHAAGTITNLHEHFLESGFFEGRFGAEPPVDEIFYAASYPDIGAAIDRGDVVSGSDHYMRSGAAEGRVPNEGMQSEVQRWAAVLSDGLNR